MRISTALGAAVLATVLWVQAAGAAGFSRQDETDQAMHFTPAHGKTLPPVGFVNFCARHQADCRSAGRSARPIPMSGERWRIVYQLNSYVNGKVTPMSDADLYGQEEHWAYPADAGDCEDYVLLKKRYLEKLGFARSALLITVVLDEKNEGHAVLTLRTDEGDFVLDNRRNEIRRWSDLDYVYLKRQSGRDPREWVSLIENGFAVSALAAGETAAPAEQ
jgi:predicted transglutaminase-like cysteine proteinase